MIRSLTLLSAATALSACASLDPYPVDRPVIAPQAYAGDLPPSGVAENWWQGFGDSVLDDLVEQGLAANLDIAIARDRLRARVLPWRWPLLSAAGVACIVGAGFVALPPTLEWVELAVGVWAILGAYALVIWRWGFGPDDRALFRKQKAG